MSDAIAIAREALRIEAQAILDQVELINGGFEKAVKLIAATKGKVVVTGMGKSGIIGRKVSSTLASTGTPSFFMHPGEAYHGDLGMLTPDDVVLAISNSGETDEVLKIVPFFLENRNPIIAITGNKNSTLARNADIHFWMNIKKEACPLSAAPTSSTTVALALGDALAVALMRENDFQLENFARFHPGGSLGRRLLAKVEMVMKTRELPIVFSDSKLQEIINAMSRGRLGLALVNEGDKTIGIITDGDLRRLMEKEGKNSFDFKAEDFMTRQPKLIHPKASLLEAEKVFNQFKITSIVVAESTGVTVGVVQIYDL